MMRIPNSMLIVALAALPAGAQQPSLFDLDFAQAPSAEAQAFPITAEQGPVMVKAASFKGAGSLSLANSLAQELRSEYEIEAYIFRFQSQIQDIEQRRAFVKDFEIRFGVKPRMPIRYKTEPPVNWVVLAGNFDSFQSKKAKEMLEQVRKIDPKSLSSQIRQSIQLRADPGELENARKVMNFGLQEKSPNPLRTAMLVMNPHPQCRKIAVPEMDWKTKVMLLNLNDGYENSIYENDAKYTLMVARFSGSQSYSYNKEDRTERSGIDRLFGGLLPKKQDRSVENQRNGMEIARQNANKVTEQLRRNGFEAYAFHGQFASIVCVNGYFGPQDLRLEKDKRIFLEMTLGQTKLSDLSWGPEQKFQPLLIPTPRRPEF